MALAQVQAALARLYTQPDARALLQTDAPAFARAHGLSHVEVDSLKGAFLADAADFAQSLARKRWREASRAMPLDIPGPGARALFHEFAAQEPLGPMRNPALDALAFHAWLLKRGTMSSRQRSALRCSEAWLLMEQGRKRFLARLVWGKPRGGLCLALWWRWKGAVRHWQG